MEPFIEQRLIQLLRDSPAPALPVRELHETIAAETGGTPGGYAFFEASLRTRSDVFVVLETASPLGDESEWPAALRSEYERELVAAGLDTGPRVSLVAPATDTRDAWLDGTASARDALDAPLRQLRESLMRMWQASAANAGLRSVLSVALAGCVDLARALSEQDDGAPTTPGSGEKSRSSRAARPKTRPGMHRPDHPDRTANAGRRGRARRM